MSLPPPPALAPVVDRLRAAGCVFAEDEAALLLEAAAGGADLDALVGRRVAGEPLEQVLGWAAFAGLRVTVEPGVFVPRRRTELMVETAVGMAPDPPPDPVVAVDLCCGSGAVGLALLTALAAHGAQVELHAADVDPVAVRCARRNLEPAGGTVHLGDLDAALPSSLRGRVHLMTANTPYVPTGELALLPPEARLHEPRHTLDGGPDGLDLLRRIASVAPGWLAPGGALLIEIGRAQVPDATQAFAAAGLDVTVGDDDESDDAQDPDGGRGGMVVVGRRR